MIKREFTAIYQKNRRWFSAWIEEIPGVNTQGRTLREARENLKEALFLVLETNRILSSAKAKNSKRELLRVAMPA
ncbi:MAG: type II toxin-antitoxin system HicB family antitoxin [Patescibacteria group bacterium]